MKRYIGTYGAADSWLISELHKKYARVVVLCDKRAKAEVLASDLRFFVPDVLELPAWDTLPFEPVSPQVEVSAERLSTLYALNHQKSYVCVVPAAAAVQKLLPNDFVEELTFRINVGDEIDRNSLLLMIDNAGYQRVSLVEKVGDCAVRGAVIDIFPPAIENPLRIEFLGNKVTKIKSFDATTQRSISTVKFVNVVPVREIIPFHSNEKFNLLEAIEKIKTLSRECETPLRETAKIITAVKDGTRFPGIELISAATAMQQSIFDAMPDDCAFITLDKDAVELEVEAFSALAYERYARFEAEHVLLPHKESIFIDKEKFLLECKEKTEIEISSLSLTETLTEDRDTVNVHSIPNSELKSRLIATAGQTDSLKPLKTAVTTWRKRGYNIAFVVASPTRAERLQSILLSLNIDAPFQNSALWLRHAARVPVAILDGELSEGFQLPEQKLVFIAETEIFTRRSHRQGKALGEKTIKRLLNSISELKDGDFVVHEEYGVAIYHGLVNLKVEDIQADFLHLEYADSQLYVPIQHITKVQKYVGVEGEKPTIDKLSSSRWSKTKLKIKQAVAELAGDLIRLYAARSVANGFKFEKEGPDDDSFADGFEFDETPDQLSAIKATLKDMASPKPMDRLICGDVGFGKTEVAMRAAFKCIQSAKQVGVLVPTTVLVEQHAKSFKERFEGYPVKIAALSRFHPAAENKKTLEGVANHDIDIVIGTHKLLQKNVAFKDLGLLIIDEEHRFGVKQKERLKQLKKQVDVLTMTATPIPRTLHLSLLNIRDISVINTPPVNRQVIRTYIASRSDTLIRDALIREHQRGGQTFFIHNRVQSIFGIGAALSELVPELRVECAHGQMSETQLENIMQRFINKEIDVLVSTTIIESGIDIPNANTIIIDRADTFGLAQLYQLRGRVGRSNRQAYAYFLIPNTKRLGGEAQQRLKVLQSLDDLGQGFNLAIRDLEIRGAGNLLGKEQSGNVISVGYELYTKILTEAISNLKGEELSLESLIDPEVKFPINAFIPDFYIPDVSERLVMYQRLASIASSAEADEILSELDDRFGGLPVEAANLLEVMRLRSLLKHYGLTKAEWSKEKLYLTFSHNAKIDLNKLLMKEKLSPKRYKLTKNLTLVISKKDGAKEGMPAIETIYHDVEKLLDEIRA